MVFLLDLLIVQPWDSVKPELFTDLGLVALCYGEFFTRSVRDHAFHGIGEALDVEQPGPSHLILIVII